jgi:methyltransferase (TIGR00027 family)
MEEGSPSRMAILTAMLRGAHYILDVEPRILDDSFARAFAGFSSDEELLKALDDLKVAEFIRRRTLLAVRNRYAEDELVRSVAQGMTQYVILGAGLDSFAYRRRDLLQVLDVYEVDHPASQAWKRQRVEELGIKIPERLHYVPVDFERETLTNGLSAAGVNLRAATFFSWLGVTQYLTSTAVLNTLREIARLAAPGSEIVFQLIVPAATLVGEERALVEVLAARSAAVGEPWLSSFTPEELEVHLKQLGFKEVIHFGPHNATERYLTGRSDQLRLPAYFHMIDARVS